jgi:predicted TIM-barrel fold metal-dependent hydrolase
MVGRPLAEFTLAPAKYDEFRRGVWDPRARLDDMDLNGVYASLNFPSSVWGFAGRRFSTMRDQEAGLASLLAYNDWMLDEWCATDRDRYIPCQVPWLSDPVRAAQEVRRNRGRGFRAVSFSENPELLGFPHLYSEHWDPFFAACDDTGTVVNLHVGSSGAIVRPSSVSPSEVSFALFPLNGVLALVDWVFAKIPVRFPQLRIVLSEAGVSWVPMVLERLARSRRQMESSTTWSATDPDPVEVVRRNFWFTSIEEPSAFRLLDLIGSDRVMVEADYPHADSSWPDTQGVLRACIGSCPPSVVRRLCYENAAALYEHPCPPERLLAASVIGRTR